jgi:hypothetical protein
MRAEAFRGAAAAAVVTIDPLLPEVKGHGHAAIRAADYEAAELTLEEVREAATVQKDEALLTPLIIFLESLPETVREQTP